MHAAIRSYRVIDAEAFVQKVEDEFVERVKSVRGFVGYYVVSEGLELDDEAFGGAFGASWLMAG